MRSSLETLIRNIIIRKIEFALQGNIEALPPSIENEINTPEFPEKLKNWSKEEVDNREIQSLCDNAVTILQYCSRHKNDAASEYATEFVKKLHEKLITDFDFNNQPEQFHWTEVSKGITRFLATYISLANLEDNAEIKRSICHEVISKMTPPLSPKLPWTYKSSDTIISLSLPRVFTYFLYDEDKLKEEVKDGIFVIVGEQYNNLHNNEELRDNFGYYKFYDSLYTYYLAAIKDTRLLDYRKIYDNDDNNGEV
ncbi:hypothetical protein KQX54_015015 [Cotesia glomerata]|uniref:Uncharacterized protein n=1 Tax=Cotesia glomerata TaxID=32391 RepID=A0AAV7IQU5_COTGL|nr:hypothetical protein KQX54_015015 [Cotesia glomerata]